MRSSNKSPAARRSAAPSGAPKRTSAVVSRAGQQQTLAFPEGRTESRAPYTAVSHKPKQLWLCVHLPKLTLESLYRDDVSSACAVFEEQQGIRRIREVNTLGSAAGVCPGMSVNAALALAPALRLAERDSEQEARLLSKLASWAERFTSFVVLDGKDLLLLEIAGSERLFGDLRSIRKLVVRDLHARGLTASVAIAPTPLASSWLARSKAAVCIEDRAHLVGHLSRLPLTSLAWSGATLETLTGMGISTIGDCLRLPRAGFARRFGASHLRQLDQALGRLPDPRTHHRVPEPFCGDYEFDEEQTDQEFLLAACRELLGQFERFVRTRQVRVLQVRFRFFHLRGAATQLTLGRMQAGQDVDHWFDLLKIKFEQVELPAGVISIRLRSAPGQSSVLTTDDFVTSSAQAVNNSPSIYLLERFRARLGISSVHGLEVIAEHRPQHAWCPVPLLEEAAQRSEASRWPCELEVHAASGAERLLLRRPLWMLNDPARLETQAGMPLHHGEPLTLLSDPERVETGWWDEQGIARDYFAACTSTGMHVWVYRDRRPEQEKTGWYLHGLFA